MIMLCLVLCDYRKIVDVQPRYIHSRLSQDALLRREKVRSPCVVE